MKHAWKEALPQQATWKECKEASLSQWTKALAHRSLGRMPLMLLGGEMQLTYEQIKEQARQSVW